MQPLTAFCAAGSAATTVARRRLSQLVSARDSLKSFFEKHRRNASDAVTMGARIEKSAAARRPISARRAKVRTVCGLLCNLRCPRAKRRMRVLISAKCSPHNVVARPPPEQRRPRSDGPAAPAGGNLCPRLHAQTLQLVRAGQRSSSSRACTSIISWMAQCKAQTRRHCMRIVKCPQRML